MRPDCYGRAIDDKSSRDPGTERSTGFITRYGHDDFLTGATNRRALHEKDDRTLVYMLLRADEASLSSKAAGAEPCGHGMNDSRIEKSKDYCQISHPPRRQQ